MDTVQITALIGAVASLVCTLVVGALTFFLKKTLSSLEKADERNAAKIAEVEKDLNDLKADLPLIYVTREDFIRVSNNIDKKLDRLLYRSERKEE
ncbi:hypothetical protein [Alistipes sp.]|uniref:hypothetical protein n=1 Tax=Alistipes sp. TaxID=1872444 RepID=UPI0031FC5565